MKILHNYHTHTTRCGHAMGSDEEYVLAAIKAGYKSLGFSDHICSHGFDYQFLRMPESKLEDYIESILTLKEKYKDQIDIYLGLESEYCLEQIDFYHHLLDNTPIEYLVFGAHCIDHLNTESMIGGNATPKRIMAYVDNVIRGMESGLYVYLAHPDLYMKNYAIFDQTCKEAAIMICNKSKELNIPIEINLEGIKVGLRQYNDGKIQRYRYPVEEFWQIAGEIGCPVIIGVDAHDPAGLSHQESFDYTKYLVDKYHLQVLKDNYLPIHHK